MKSERVIKGKLMNESKVPEGLALPSARSSSDALPGLVHHHKRQ